MHSVAVALPILAIIVVILLLVEVRQYRMRRHLITRRRFVLRLVTGALMLVLLSGVFVGLFVLRLSIATEQPGLFFAYWSGCLAVAVILVLVMLADMQDVEGRSSEREHEIWRDMASFVAKQTSHGKSGGTSSGASGETAGEKQGESETGGEGKSEE